MKRRLHKPKPRHRTVEPTLVTLFQRALLRWWKGPARTFPWRDTNATLYHQIVSEVLLQRTRAETVAAFWPQFIRRFPTWESLAASSESEIEKILQPIGLSKQRAPRLYALAQTMTAQGGRFSTERREIEDLPGVGQYIANAIFTFAHKQPSPLLDTNMARVLERVFGARKLADIRYDPYLQTVANQLVRHRRGAEINWAVLDLAALICTIRDPKCGECPLSVTCAYASKLQNNSKQSRPSKRVRLRKKLAGMF